MTVAATLPERLTNESGVVIRRLAVSLAAVCLSGCVTLTVEPRAVIAGTGGADGIATLNCDVATRVVRGATVDVGDNALDRQAFRVLIWNLHKQDDSGWQRDLTYFAGTNDVLLLQETVLQASLRNILADAGLGWVMASSFMYDANDIGVLTATRVAPLASCTQRMLEPLLRIPKSAIITWLRIKGTRDTLAIVNLHAINFDPFIDGYRAQFAALGEVLAEHQGPIIFAGDFNTWSDARDGVVAETAARIGMTELKLRDDRRAVFFGRHFDHVFVRGLESVDVAAVPVTSSDHNPLVTTLRIR